MPEQPDLDAMCDSLCASLDRYVPPLVVRSGSVTGKRDHQLWSERKVVVDGRPRKEIYFAGVIVQKGYVGLYFMPVYTHADARDLFAPELLRLLKGKSCFHITHLGDELLGHVDDALAKGYALYRERGWVE
jgi:hypothetical protein